MVVLGLSKMFASAACGTQAVRSLLERGFCFSFLCVCLYVHCRSFKDVEVENLLMEINRRERLKQNGRSRCVSGFRITQLTSFLTELNEKGQQCRSRWESQSGSAAEILRS